MKYQARDLCFYDECDILDLLKAARKYGAEKVGVYSADWGEEKFNLDDSFIHIKKKGKKYQVKNSNDNKLKKQSINR